MRKLSTFVAVVALAGSLSACAGMQGGPGGGGGLLGGIDKSTIGAGIGGIGGGALCGLFGNKIGGGVAAGALSGACALGGAFLGGQIGASLDKADKLYADRTLSQAQPGQTQTWNNPNTGNRVSFTPGPQVQAPNNVAAGSVCRQYQSQIVTRDGTASQGQGTACMSQNGEWSY